MQHRQQVTNQEAAAAKAGISARSGRRIESALITPCPKSDRGWRTREDPLEAKPFHFDAIFTALMTKKLFRDFCSSSR